MEPITLTIEQGDKGRLDKVLAGKLGQYSRSKLQRWIKKGLVLVNHQPVADKYKVCVGDVVEVTPEKPHKIDLEPEDIPLDVVYEDDDVLVVNKPQGMVVHPAPGHANHTLVNALLYHCPLSTINGEFRPGIVHRIDKDTSGLLMVAKNDQAHRCLAAQLKAKTTKREYIALVHGRIKENSGTIDAPLGRSHKDRKKQAVVEGGRHAVTHFQVIERFNAFTLIKCRLETGRTHQIRVHMTSIGHPLAGDPLYGPRKTLPGKGQYLHAKVLGFVHPRTGKQMLFSAPLPADFQQMVNHLRQTKRE